ncbi:NUDIX hydrolase [Catenulispora sp. NF23]|uniref:NUDIX hydrolase n=1 Tax=Catenulispora pinistramenti TaxID=2705254 RepID=UPI001BAA3059|nr:NUDIX hydrolase [Catenulispora pinistramenti]MBS2533296.1 NUDIX hydrolase [Catenulispora pinistramenti]
MNSARIRPARAVTFEQVIPQQYTLAERTSIATHWNQASEANPHLFDGPIIAVRGISWHQESCRIRWSIDSYASYLWRYATDNVDNASFARALFASVVVLTTTGQLVLGSMAASTAVPGRVQLPGGNVEQPPSGGPLSLDSVSADAVRELWEETGLRLPADGVTLWAVKDSGAFGDVGLLYRATGVTTAQVREAFLFRSQNRVLPEFTSLLLPDLVDRAESSAILDGSVTYVDYLPALLEALNPHVIAPEAAAHVRG